MTVGKGDEVGVEVCVGAATPVEVAVGISIGDEVGVRGIKVAVGDAVGHGVRVRVGVGVLTDGQTVTKRVLLQGPSQKPLVARTR